MAISIGLSLRSGIARWKGAGHRDQASDNYSKRDFAGLQPERRQVVADWFEALTGFQETTYAETRSKLRIEGNQLRSLVNGRCYDIGELELVSLRTLRQRVENILRLPRGQTPKFSEVSGDVRRMHRMPENDGALFQVASQFNLLEMTGPTITPEHGVARYQFDRTQGPACAIAAGAAPIYRNYFAQTPERQLDGLLW